MKRISLSDIRADGGTQTRAELRVDTIEEYAEAMAAGAEFPPVELFLDKAGHYWLADGFHRYQAALRAEAESLNANIRKGELREAIWFALSANSTNGLRRTNADKRRCVQIALSDNEWAAMSDNAIAEHCGVSQPYVGEVRRQLITVISSTEPPKRKGKDGKSRKAPAKKPKPEPAKSPVKVVDEDEPEESDTDIMQDAHWRARASDLLDELTMVLGKLGAKCDRELNAIRSVIE